MQRQRNDGDEDPDLCITVEPRFKNIGYNNILGSTIGLAGTDLVHTNYCNIPCIRILLAICSSFSESIVVTSLITL
jgi:hypothetical protein